MVLPGAIALTCVAFLLDASGRYLDEQRLWIAGAHTASAAMVCGLAGLLYWSVSGIGRGRWRGVIAWLCGLGFIALARWLRGTAGVAPDRPLIGALGLGALLLLLGWGRRARAQRSAAISPSR